MAALALSGMLSALVVAAPSTAQAYCRTTTEMPANFRPDPDCFVRGYPLFWRNACVGYDIYRSASKLIPYDVASPLIERAFATWSNARCDDGGHPSIEAQDLGPVTCGNVDYDTEGPNHNVIVFREDGWPYSDAGSTLGLTTVTFNPNTGEIYDADMEINVSGANLSATDVVPKGGYDFLSVVTHEAGHFLGLAHAAQPTSTMYPSYTQGSDSLRDLAADDIEGICSIYPSSGQRNVGKVVDPSGVITADRCDATPRHGFISSCEGTAPPASADTGSSCAVAVPASSSQARFVLPAVALGALTAGLVRRRRARA